MGGIAVAVVGGGTSCEHDASVASAASVGEALAGIGYQVTALTIDRGGRWLDAAGRPIGLTGAVELLASCAVAMPMLHGPGGEDGALVALCELAGVPYVGSPLRAGALAMDRWATKLVAEAVGVRTAAGTLVTRDAAQHVAGMFAADLPLVIRPATYGASHGVSVARTQEELVVGLEVGFALDDRVLVEEVVHGREIDVAVLGSPGGNRMVAPALEILAPESGRFDVGTAYDGPARFLVPAPLSGAESSRLREAAVTMYDALGCAGVTRVDFLLTDTGPVLGGVNTAPTLTAHSPVPRMFEAAGIGYPELLALLVEDARVGARSPVADGVAVAVS